MLDKLPFYGLDYVTLLWFRHYLYPIVDRKLEVLAPSCYDQSVSSWDNIDYVVPHVSILGPLLFSVYINDLSKAVKSCSIDMYADDTMVYVANDLDRFDTSDSGSLDLIIEWLRSNEL